MCHHPKGVDRGQRRSWKRRTGHWLSKGSTSSNTPLTSQEEEEEEEEEEELKKYILNLNKNVYFIITFIADERYFQGQTITLFFIWIFRPNANQAVLQLSSTLEITKVLKPMLTHVIR